jgi:hypothetical protein
MRRVARRTGLQVPANTIPLQHPIQPLAPEMHNRTRSTQPDAQGYGQSRRRIAGPLQKPEPQPGTTRTPQEKHSPQQHETLSDGISDRWSRKIMGAAAHDQRRQGNCRKPDNPSARSEAGQKTVSGLSPTRAGDSNRIKSA